MLLRVLLLFTAMLLLTATIASLFTPRELREGRGARVLADVRPVAGPAGGPKVVKGRFPREGPLTVAEGSIVELTVAAKTPDVAELLDLGLEAPIGPGLDGSLQFVADRAGRFALTSVVSGRPIGVLVVRPRR